jgi:predicted dehydrogenase
MNLGDQQEEIMVRAAIVGLGWRGKHVIGRMRGSKKLEIVAALDASGANAAFAAEHGLRFTMDWDELIDDRAIEVIILCTPHFPQTRQVFAAAGAGKHMFCDSPLAASRADSEGWATVCGSAGVILGFGHERRFEPAATELRRMVNEGVLGTILHVEAQFSQDESTGDPEEGWCALRAASGLTPLGADLAELCLDLFGPVAEVHGQEAGPASNLPNCHVASVRMRFASGATGSLNSIPATPLYIGMTVFGSEGWLEIRNQGHRSGLTTLTYQSRKGYADTVELEWEDAVCANLDAFADAIEKGGGYPVAHGKFAAAAMFDAIRQSAARNMPVHIIKSSSGTRRRPVAAIA